MTTDCFPPPTIYNSILFKEEQTMKGIEEAAWVEIIAHDALAKANSKIVGAILTGIVDKEGGDLQFGSSRAMCDTEMQKNVTYKEELLDYVENDEKAPGSAGVKVNGKAIKSEIF
ncbi:hypothetical protein L6452_02961 [Arctium lappa]|uniref:Uncharacterized protein n=1 Tax=Arctium lappa TaxID=4217 RepID=A0ACB9FLH5_ARCLA|nr:hypothetical protein L6452_02961 [Arctium lappa]